MRRMVYAALLGMAVAWTAAVCAGDAAPAPGLPDGVRWRAEFPEPATGGALAMRFDGDAVLAVSPGNAVQITAVAHGRSAAVRVVHDEGDGRGPWAERLVLTLPIPATGEPGSRRLRFEVGRDGRVFGAPVTAWLHPPWTARAVGTGGFGEVRAGGAPVGTYRAPASAGAHKVKTNPDAYRPPALFMPLWPDTLHARVTPRLRVGDLVVPSDDTGERHTALAPVNYALWRAAETIRDALAARGVNPDALKIISGFRAPAYNRRVGSGHFGRHAYGDAFDFMLDADGDGATDDLTGDGRVDRQDGLWMVALLEDLMADGRIPFGGVGCYVFATSPKKVTWHYDQRGHRATWGYQYDARGKRAEFAWQSRRYADLDAREQTEAAARAKAEGKPYRAPRRDPLPALPPAKR